MKVFELTARLPGIQVIDDVVVDCVLEDADAHIRYRLRDGWDRDREWVDSLVLLICLQEDALRYAIKHEMQLKSAETLVSDGSSLDILFVKQRQQITLLFQSLGRHIVVWTLSHAILLTRGQSEGRGFFFPLRLRNYCQCS